MLKEREFVEALRKIGFSGPICESINEIRKAVFETSEAKWRQIVNQARRGYDYVDSDKNINPFASRNKSGIIRDAIAEDGDEDYEVENETNENDDIGSDESLKAALVERALRKGCDIAVAREFAEKEFIKIDRDIDALV